MGEAMASDGFVAKPGGTQPRGPEQYCHSSGSPQ